MKFQEKVDAVREALQDLGASLIDEGLNAQYRERTAALDQEDAEQAAEAQSLQQEYLDLKPVGEANVKKLNDQATDLMAEARKDESAAKTEEAHAVQQELEEIPTKIQVLKDRRLAIAAEKQEIARRLFREQCPIVQQGAHGAIEILIDFLDGLKAGFYTYAETTNSQGQFPGLLIRPNDLDQLTPVSGPLSQRVDGWFGSKR